MDILGNCDVRPSVSSGFRIEVSEARETPFHQSNPQIAICEGARAPSSHDSPVGRVMCSRVLRLCLSRPLSSSIRATATTADVGNWKHVANTIRGSLYILSLHYFSGKTATKEGRNQPRRSLARPFSAGYFGKAGYLSCKRTANPLCHAEGPSLRHRPPAVPTGRTNCLSLCRFGINPFLNSPKRCRPPTTPPFRA